MTSENRTQVNTADVLAIDAQIAQRTDAGEYGLTPSGFVPKPFSRLLAEKLSLARALFGEGIDLSSESAIRKLCEVSALEDARTWAALATMYDDQFVSTAKGAALSALGAELGLARPFETARGVIRLTLATALPAGVLSLELPRGARLMTQGLHHVALEESVTLSAENSRRDVSIVAFYPGAEHNLDPAKDVSGQFPEKIVKWNTADEKLSNGLLAIATTLNQLPEAVVSISHTEALKGGELGWSDTSYRELLLRAPRSLWSVDAVRMVVSLVPGVRQVQVHDNVGGLDIQQPIFGYFAFFEKLFGAERDVSVPYFFSVIVAPTESAIWNGVDGLAMQIESALEDIRPMGIYPDIRRAQEVWVAVKCNLVVKGLPLPRTSKGAVLNDSDTAKALKLRLLARVKQYVRGLGFGEPVRAAEIVWSLMNEPGIVDVQQLELLRYPPAQSSVVSTQPPSVKWMATSSTTNIELQGQQIASLVDEESLLTIV